MQITPIPQNRIPREVQMAIARLFLAMWNGTGRVPEDMALVRSDYARRGWPFERAMTDLAAQVEVLKMKQTLGVR